ncbi:MAG: exodeoxyribonuclease VII large subunit [Deltaproteobacteria bacterium]|jgi:exodeoxyribonuclease VII large subunit|nr:exodeoxyribonuclease VII large subunit [Deltaproteobacteria bacterium]
MSTDPKLYTPTELANLIQSTFTRHVGQINLIGEVSSLVVANSGHAYLQIKDKSAMIKGVVWRSSKISSGISAIQSGLMVQAKGKLSNYAPKSEYQLTIDRIVPMGEGSLSLAFEKLKLKLGNEGLFQPERKREIAKSPRRVALLAAAGSAAVSDFLTTSVERHRGAWISLFSVRVQGKGAAEEMAEALELINGWGGFDLVVMTRGGGSLEDLWAYNEEILVRAVANSRLPILAAVGHSTDLSLVEMAADARAITPTAAAETVYPLDSDLLAEIDDHLTRLKNLAKTRLLAKRGQLQSHIGQLGQLRYKLNNFSQLIDSSLMKLENSVRKLIAASRSRLEALTVSLDHKSPHRDQALKREKLDLLRKNLISRANGLTQAKRAKLDWLMNALNLVSPLNVLTRGYAVATAPDGRVIRSADQVQIGHTIDVRLAEGTLKAQVQETSPAPAKTPPESD